MTLGRKRSPVPIEPSKELVPYVGMTLTTIGRVDNAWSSQLSNSVHYQVKIEPLDTRGLLYGNIDIRPSKENFNKLPVGTKVQITIQIIEEAK
jgi:hypothetical protein